MATDFLFRLKNTLLFEKLLVIEQSENKNNLLSSKILDIVSYATPLLGRIPENMPEYTLHDPNHSAKVVELIAKIIPSQVLDSLNSIEITLLILSGYLHDIGMTASREEKENIINHSEEFKILFKSDSDKFTAYNNYKSSNQHRLATFIEDQIFTEFLRRNHVRRSADFIKTNFSSGKNELSINDIPFWKILIAVCDGHGEPVSSLQNTTKWPRETLVGEKIINTQYLSVLLRLADILDLDPERTPKVIYEFVNPSDPVSIIEWKKHRSIIGHSINSRKILFEAECTSPEVERALKQFIDWIEIERKESLQLINSYNDSLSQKYYLTLTDEVTKDRIKSDDSYISNDLKFEIEYKNVLDLLMGQKLYKNPIVAMRELLQNSIDAIKVREAIFTNKSEAFKPFIEISITNENIVVKDNGVGMDEGIFKNYFLQVGKSFSSSPIFYTNFSDVDITSEFGIGVLSVFMIADHVTVESRKEPNNPLTPPMPILFEIPTAYSYTTQRKSTKVDVGTIITLRLKKNHPFKGRNIASILEEIMPITPYEVTLNSDGVISTYNGVSKTQITPFPDPIDYNEAIKYAVRDFYEPATDYTHSAAKITFTQTDALGSIGVMGDLYLINGSTMNWRRKTKGYIAQRNFRIGLPAANINEDFFIRNGGGNIHNLLPMWASCFCEINLTRSACLSVFPDRTDVLIDEKYIKLKHLFENRIIEELDKIFDFKGTPEADLISIERVYTFLAAGFIGLDSNNRDEPMSSEAKDFFCRSIFVRVIHNKSLQWMSLGEIIKFKKICIISNGWEEGMEQTTEALVEGFNAVIVALPKTKFYSEHTFHTLLRFVLGKNVYELQSEKVLTGALPAFAINVIDNYSEKADENDSNNRIVFGIGNSLSAPMDKIVFIIGSALTPYPIFNAAHPIINILFNNEQKFKSTEAKNLLTELSNHIGQFIYNCFEKAAALNSDYLHTYIRFSNLHNQDFDKLSIGIITYYPLFIEEINGIFLDYWNDVKLHGLSIEEMIPLSPADFPNFWK